MRSSLKKTSLRSLRVSSGGEEGAWPRIRRESRPAMEDWRKARLPLPDPEDEPTTGLLSAGGGSSSSREGDSADTVASAFNRKTGLW